MKLNDLLARELGSTPSKDEVMAARVLQSLAARSLPPQRRSLSSRWWPTALLTADFAPAWPRVVALACAAWFGVAVGLFGLDVNLFALRSVATVASAADGDVASLFFEAEPLTGVRP